MAPTSARTRPAHLWRLGLVATVVAAGCTGAPTDHTGVSSRGTAPPPSASPPVQDPGPTGQDMVSPPDDLPTPPDLSANTIDCDAVEGPCDRGDDPELDRLWEACADGAGGACDRLYYDAGFDTRYEQFGNTCGDRGLTVPCPGELEGASA